MQRPQRIRIKNESGKLQSLPEGKEYFQDLGGNGDILLLGLGPIPEKVSQLFPQETTIHYIECPQFENQIPAYQNISSQFSRLKPEQLQKTADYRIILYTPNKKLFPSFWGPLISQLTLQKTGISKKQRSKTVWIPGDGNSLLIPELSNAFADAGFTYRVIDPEAMCKNMLSLLDQELPEMVLSINYKGLDSSGETYFMLREAGIKVVVWMVDNPFHIISDIKSDFWKQVPSMVTDHWFIEPLKELGAEKISHLPLATDPKIFHPQVQKFPLLENRIVFVGRSSFPDKDTFFAGCSFSKDDHKAATDAINAGTKPDFKWWSRRDGLPRFWPGRQVRETGFRTEQSGLMWRSAALASVRDKLTLFGDKGWKHQLDKPDLRPPVDYFTAVPSIYAGAGTTLNMTSPLLPCGLTQRNFDVWAAGGFLLTDYTPGLSIFPDDLTAECSFASPGELPALCEKFERFPKLKESLTKIWLKIILAEHTYKNRVDNILNFLQ